MDSKEKTLNKERLTFSKKWTNILLIVGLIDLQLSYILAFLGLNIAENLSIAIVTYIIGVFVVYSTKAFFGKKEEEKTRIQEMSFAQTPPEFFNSQMEEPKG